MGVAEPFASGDLAALSEKELIRQYSAARKRIRALTGSQELARATTEQDMLSNELFPRLDPILGMFVNRLVQHGGFCPRHWSPSAFSEECMGSIRLKLVDSICAYDGRSLQGFLRELALNTVTDRWRHEVGRGPQRRRFEPIEPTGRPEDEAKDEPPFRSPHWEDLRKLMAERDRTEILVKLLTLHIGSSPHGRRSGCAIASYIWAERSFPEIAQKQGSSLEAIYKLFSRDYRELQNLAKRVGISLHRSRR